MYCWLGSILGGKGLRVCFFLFVSSFECFFFFFGKGGFWGEGGSVLCHITFLGMRLADVFSRTGEMSEMDDLVNGIVIEDAKMVFSISCMSIISSIFFTLLQSCLTI